MLRLKLLARRLQLEWQLFQTTMKIQSEDLPSIYKVLVICAKLIALLLVWSAAYHIIHLDWAKLIDDLVMGFGWFFLMGYTSYLDIRKDSLKRSEREMQEAIGEVMAWEAESRQIKLGDMTNRELTRAEHLAGEDAERGLTLAEAALSTEDPSQVEISVTNS